MSNKIEIRLSKYPVSFKGKASRVTLILDGEEKSYITIYPEKSSLFLVSLCTFALNPKLVAYKGLHKILININENNGLISKKVKELD